jgi:HPr kinase/phosphorylase
VAAVAELVHATCIALDGRGVLIRGPSGSGKSDLALRCLAVPANGLIEHAAALVADDYVALECVADRLIARAPPALRHKLEVRGQGIVTVASIESAEIVLIAELVSASEAIERLPDPVVLDRVCGKLIPVLRLHSFEASAAAKLLVALAARYGHTAE